MDRNVLRLATAQALSGANNAVVYATAAIIGNTLAPRPGLATLPISVFVIGMALSTLPVGWVTRRYGRITAFMLGNLCGVIIGVLAAIALLIGSFVLFNVAMLFGGAYAAVILTFRFAAAECVPAPLRARALSSVLAGGVLAGVLGPRLATVTMDAWPPHDYALTYLAAAGVALLSALVLVGVRFEHGPQKTSLHEGRPLSVLLRQPRLIVAMLCGLVSYMMMNFMMTAAPLAMELTGLHRADANFGVELHVIAMYAPSFFTGRLITRYGAPWIILLGLLGIALAALVGMAGLSTHHFWWSLVLLGIGWNFSFLGASALVLSCHEPNEGAKVQSVNDFTIFGAMVIGSFASGGLLASYGWEIVAGLALPPVVIAAIAILWLHSRRLPKAL